MAERGLDAQENQLQRWYTLKRKRCANPGKHRFAHLGYCPGQPICPWPSRTAQ